MNLAPNVPVESMKRLFSFYVCFRRRINCFIQSKVYFFLIDFYVRLKQSCGSKCAHPDATCFTVSLCSPVLSIFTFCCKSNVFNPVVVSYAVNVVDAFWRKATVNIKPCKSMGRVSATINNNNTISLVANTSGTLSSKIVSNANGFVVPRKNTCFVVVVEKFAQAFCGKIGLSHAVVPCKQWFGQKPRRVTSTSGLRYFSSCINKCTV